MTKIGKNPNEATAPVTRRWPKSHSIFIEDCDFTNSGIDVLFCKYADRNNVEAEWQHVKIDAELLKAYTLQVLKDTCTDSTHPVTGEHVQTTTHINQALVDIHLIDYLQTYVKLYIEDAQPYTLLPHSSIN